MTWIPRLNLWAENWWQWVTHAGWQAAVVCVVALAVVAAGRRWSAPLRYALLLIALLKFATPPMLTAPTGLFSAMGPQVERVAPISEIPGRLQPVPNLQLVRMLADDLDRDMAMAQLRRLPPVSAPLHWKAWLMIGHGLGILLMLRWVIAQAFNLSKVKFDSVPIRQGEQFEDLKELAAAMKLRRVPELYISATIEMPIAFGIVRPTIVLPDVLLSKLGTEQLRMILAHELAHFRRGDLWINAVQLGVLSFWWFQPFCWILNCALRRVREDCCDDLLLARQFTSKETYCDMLMCAARELAPRRGSVPALALGENLHPVAKRLIRIMDAELARVPRLPLWGAVVVTLAGLAVLPGLHSHPAVRLDNIMPRVVHGAARTVSQFEVDPEVRTLGLTALTEMLRDERRADRAKAIPALAAMGPEAEAAVPALEAFLASTHPERWKALDGFMGIYSARDPLALGYVMKGVDDKDPEVRQRSIEMLALFPHFAMEISGKLFGLLNAPDPEARFRAAAVLWQFDRSNADRIVDTVRLELLRRVPTEREHEAIEILAEMGANGRSALPALREVAEDAGRTESVRAAAKRSLERIEKAVGLR